MCDRLHRGGTFSPPYLRAAPKKLILNRINNMESRAEQEKKKQQQELSKKQFPKNFKQIFYQDFAAPRMRPIYPVIAMWETCFSGHCTERDQFIQSLHCDRPVYPVIALWQTCLSSHCIVTDLFIQSLHCERPVYPVIALWETCLFKDTLTDTTDT